MTYIDIEESDALYSFKHNLHRHLAQMLPLYAEAVILCIGTDRATGDSLGPLVGHKLKNMPFADVSVYGTLDAPVHARNLHTTLDIIAKNHPNALIIAIDACLGRTEHIGHLTVNQGSIRPGSGVNKLLPAVGDISITGIVNLCTSDNSSNLQSTRLSLVMRMADIVSAGLWAVFGNLKDVCFEDYSVVNLKNTV